MKRTKKQSKAPAYQTFFQSTVKTPDELIDIIKTYTWATVSKMKTRFYNIPIAFDIETSSFYFRGEKCAIMYEWTLSFNGIVVIGRTWGEFLDLCDRICEVLNVSVNNRLVIYVHNLSFEFQFMRKFFEWKNVFALDAHKPVRALTTSGIEFRCSYILSGYALETIANNLQSVDLKKLKGDLDYSLIRTPETSLTPREIQYCINDVQIVVAYIGERIVIDKGIAKIPLTKTGYVRRYCRKACFYEFKF